MYKKNSEKCPKDDENCMQFTMDLKSITKQSSLWKAEMQELKEKIRRQKMTHK